MRLFIIGPIPAGGYPFLPDEFDQIVIADLYDGVAEVEWPCAVVVVTRDTRDLSEEVLDLAAEVIEAASPYDYMVDMARPGDLAFLDWDDSDAMYDRLKLLQIKDVSALDMNDGFQELEIGATPDFESLVEALTARVTKEVLKVVRAELENVKGRRYRQSGTKV